MDEATEVGPQARADLRDDLHRQVRESVAEGRPLRPRGRGARGARRVLPADGAHRSAQGDAGLRRGDVRAGRGGDPGHGRGGRHPPGQRLGVRSRRRRLHPGRGPRRADRRRRAPRGCVLRQRVREVGSAAAVRGREGLGLRTRARPRSASGSSSTSRRCGSAEGAVGPAASRSSPPASQDGRRDRSECAFRGAGCKHQIAGGSSMAPGGEVHAGRAPRTGRRASPRRVPP